LPVDRSISGNSLSTDVEGPNTTHKPQNQHYLLIRVPERYFRYCGDWAVFDGVMVRDDLRVEVDLIVSRSELLSLDDLKG